MTSITNDLAVVGSGLAGMAAAVSAATTNPNLKIVLFEKMRSAGRKLLIAGSGQCNISHQGQIKSFFDRYGKHGQFVRPALLEYPNTALFDMLRKEKVALECTPGGKIFPASRKSIDIRDLFLRLLRERKVAFALDNAIEKIEHNEDGFRLTTRSGEVRHSRACLIATGGRTWPQTGSTGDGWLWAESLGHTIVSPRPALAAITIRERQWSVCAGVSFDCQSATLVRNGKKIETFSGDILITHTGLSGPGILDHSRYMQSGDRLLLNLVDGRNRELFRHDLDEKIAASPLREISSLMKEFGVAASLVELICHECQIPSGLRAGQTNRELRNRLVESFCSFECTIASLEGFDRAMVTAGGVALAEVDRKTMMSRIVPGLFFAGEVLDVDGDTGGYNLQFAWSSGMLAGREAAKRFSNSIQTQNI